MLRDSFTVTRKKGDVVVWSHVFTWDTPEKLDPELWVHALNNPEISLREQVIRQCRVDFAQKLRSCKTEKEAVKLWDGGLKANDTVRRVQVVEKVVHTFVRKRSEGEFTSEQMAELREQLDIPMDEEVRIKFID